MGVEQFFKSKEGYKITNAHFKLGSKIHINNFYYAKRLFYNSFFANRFAFLISNYLIENNIIVKKKKYTLLGYSSYSDLLLSNTRRLLNENEYNINHDILLENGVTIKNSNNIRNNIIVIIPISSTFSTSLKIENSIIKIFNNKNEKLFNEKVASLKDQEISEKEFKVAYSDLKNNFKNKKIESIEFINVLAIGPNDFENFKRVGYNEKNKKILEYFDWKNIDIEKKLITVNVIKETTQKYFIPLYTDWHKIHDCELCFHENYNEEKCLLETSKSSVTPNLIFEYPKFSSKEQGKNLYTIFKPTDDKVSVVIRKHIKNNNSNFIYYLKIGTLLNNKDKIRKGIQKWLESKEIHSIKTLTKNKKNVIITPSINSNSGFVNLVNEWIFNDTAIILQFSPSEDHIQNFIKFHKEILINSDEIIFVDDVLLTVRTYHLIDYYLKQIFLNKRKINFCISIINRMNYYQEQNLINVIGKENIFSYLKLNIPSLISDNYDYPYNLLIKKYKNLAKNSVLDMMRIHFEERYEVFTPDNLAREGISYRKDDDVINDLFQFLVLHEFNSLFSYKDGKYEDAKYIELIKKQRGLINKKHSFTKEEDVFLLISKFISEKIAVRDFIFKYPKYKNEIDNQVIKIFTNYPIISYKELKEVGFYWIQQRLNTLFKLIIENKDNEKFFKEFFSFQEINFDNQKIISNNKYSQYHYLKFLLKRAVKLKSSYTFSIDAFKAIQVVLNHIDNNKKDGKFFIKKYESIIVTDSQKDMFNPNKKTTAQLTVINEKEIFTIGFITYYIGIIQELIIEEETKAVKLIENVVSFIRKEKIKDEGLNLDLRNSFNNNFTHLLRLLILENTFIFETFSDYYFRDREKKLENYLFINKQIDYNSFKKKFEEYKKFFRYDALELMLYKYNYDSKGKLLEKYIDEELEDAFSKMLFVRTLIQNDITERDRVNGKREEKKFDIQKKLTIILDLLLEILNIDKNKGGYSLNIRFKYYTKSSKDIKIEDLYTIISSSNFEQNKISENSLAFEMFKGIRDKNSKKVKSILDLSNFDGEKFQYRNIVKGDKKQKPEEEIKEVSKYDDIDDYDNYLFLRISNIKKLETQPSAVITFFTNSDDNKRIDPKRIRFLLLLRDDLNKFLKFHLRNDSLNAFIEEEKHRIDINSSRHSHNVYLDALREAIHYGYTSDSLVHKSQYAFFSKQLGNMKIIQDHITSFTFDKVYPNLNSMKKFNVKDELNIIYNIIINSNRLSSHKKNYKKHIINGGDFDINFHFFHFRTLFFEYIYNGIFEMQIDTELSIDVVKNKNSCVILISNHYKNVISESSLKKLTDINRGYVEDGIKGLKLNFLLLKVCQCKNHIISINQEKMLFKISIPIKLLK